MKLINKEYWERIKKDHSQYRTKIIALFAASILLTSVFIGSIVYVNGQGSRMAITEAEIQKENDFINKFIQEERQYKINNGYLAQPVAQSDVERIQNELIQRAKNYQLNVTSVNRLPTPAASADNKKTDKTPTLTSKGIEYEIGFSGTWEMTARYLQELQNNNSLITIRSLAMKSKQGANAVIDTVIKYKIYIE